MINLLLWGLESESHKSKIEAVLVHWQTPSLSASSGVDMEEKPPEQDKASRGRPKQGGERPGSREEIRGFQLGQNSLQGCLFPSCSREQVLVAGHGLKFCVSCLRPQGNIRDSAFASVKQGCINTYLKGRIYAKGDLSSDSRLPGFEFWNCTFLWP